MQISLPLSLSLSVSLSLGSLGFFYLFYLTNKILCRPLLRPRRAFTRHLCVPLTLSLVLSSPSPTQGEGGPALPSPPSGWERSNCLCPRSPQESRFCPWHPPPFLDTISAPSSFPSHLLLLPCFPHRPPKALGFSFLKCGLNIIFGKLTALSLQLLPTSEKKEHPDAFRATSSARGCPSLGCRHNRNGFYVSSLRKSILLLFLWVK